MTIYNFTDLIARSYLKYVNKEKKEVNIAQFFFQEYHLVRPDAKGIYIFSHKQFYTEVINEINALIRGSAHNRHINNPYYKFDYNEAFEEFQQKRLLDHQKLLDDGGAPHIVTLVNYEECTNANQLKEALEHGLNLIDPVRIISPNKKIQADDLVLRKSKLEYLKTEAIRARDANSIEELDAIGPLSGMTNKTVSVNRLNHSQPNKEEIVQKYILKALEIIKPLGGIYVMHSLLDVADMKRLNEYVATLIKIGYLPMNALPFPRTKLPNQFISKTMHMVYVLIKKKHRSEFIALTHLFQQFEETEHTTTDSKFATYEGNYEEKKFEITF